MILMGMLAATFEPAPFITIHYAQPQAPTIQALYFINYFSQQLLYNEFLFFKAGSRDPT